MAQTHTAIPIFGLGNPQRSPFLSSVDRLNCIVEQTENGRQHAAVLGLPGLVRHATPGETPIRGIFAKKGALTFYLAVGGSVVVLAPNGTTQTIATLTTDSGPVWMDDNGTQLFINDGITPLIYTYSTGLSAIITDIDYQVGARGAVFLQGRFWVYTVSGSNAGRCYASDLYDGLSWNALNFITPAARPTGIVGIDRWANDLVIRGQGSVEWWSGAPTPIAGALGFQPSAPANTQVGAVAEQGSGKVGQRYFFLGESDGTAGVFELVGYQAKKVSIPAVDDAMSRQSVPTAICTGYMVNDHPIFQVTIPSENPANAMTWIYDASTEEWSRRGSHGKPYYRGLMAAGTNSAVYITDAFSGNLYKMVEHAYDEDGEVMEYEVTSLHLLQEGDGFAIDKIQIDMETGLGNPIPPGDIPHGVLQVSKDGGHTWAIERYPDLGKMGRYTMRAQEHQFGWARDFAVRFRITDPIPRRVSGAYLTLNAGFA